MILILKKLPVGITSCEFKAFVRFVISGVFDYYSQPIEKTEMMVLYDRTQGEFEFYGLIHCSSRQIGEIVSQLFDGFVLQGRVLTVAEYFPRNSTSAADASSTGVNRRRIPDEQVLVFNSIEEIEISPLLESSQTTSRYCLKCNGLLPHLDKDDCADAGARPAQSGGAEGVAATF